MRQLGAAQRLRPSGRSDQRHQRDQSEQTQRRRRPADAAQCRQLPGRHHPVGRRLRTALAFSLLLRRYHHYQLSYSVIYFILLFYFLFYYLIFYFII